MPTVKFNLFCSVVPSVSQLNTLTTAVSRVKPNVPETEGYLLLRHEFFASLSGSQKKAWPQILDIHHAAVDVMRQLKSSHH